MPPLKPSTICCGLELVDHTQIKHQCAQPFAGALEDRACKYVRPGPECRVHDQARQLGDLEPTLMGPQMPRA
jgi:hypothetical protein